MQIALGHVGVTTTVLETTATSVGAGILIGSFLMGTVGLVLGWTRQDFESRALKDGYIGGVAGVGLILFDLLMRYFV